MKTTVSIISALVLLSVTNSAIANTAVYKNSKGCEATIEQTTNGYRLFVTDAKGRQAAVGVVQGLTAANIYGFCKNADAVLEGNILTLGCNEEKEEGSYTTRGFAELDLENGLRSVEITGQVKKFGFWKTDVQISCYNLEAVVD